MLFIRLTLCLGLLYLCTKSVHVRYMYIIRSYRAYIGDILAQIAREVWGFNFFGTCQIDQTGADAKEDRKGMKVRS